MKKALLVVVCACVPLLVAPAAQAHSLSQAKAHSKAVSSVRNLCNGIDWCDAWTIEHRSDCRRRSAHTVDCEYALYDATEDQVCHDVIRLSYRNNTTRKVSRSYPYEGFECEPAS